MRLWIVMAAIGVVGGFVAERARADETASGPLPATRSFEGDGEDTKWTPERMRRARPMENFSEAPADTGGQPAAQQPQNGESVDQAPRPPNGGGRSSETGDSRPRADD